jgi:hypothetical protein
MTDGGYVQFMKISSTYRLRFDMGTHEASEIPEPGAADSLRVYKSKCNDVYAHQ